MNPAASAVAWLPSLPVPGTLLFSSFLVFLVHFLFYLVAAHPHSLNFEGVACRILFASNANTPKS